MSGLPRPVSSVTGACSVAAGNANVSVRTQSERLGFSGQCAFICGDTDLDRDLHLARRVVEAERSVVSAAGRSAPKIRPPPNASVNSSAVDCSFPMRSR